MFKKIKNVALLFVFSLLLFSTTIFGQESDGVFGHGVGESCGANRIFLKETYPLYANSVMNPKESKYAESAKMILIASLASKETDRKYNVQRLKEVKKYLTSSMVGIPDEIIILAQGERRRDQGRVEVYYGGVLQYYIKLKKNERLNLTKGGYCEY